VRVPAVSSLAQLTSPPVGFQGEPGAIELSDRVLVDLALAGDLASAMSRVVTRLRREGGVARVEWWAPTADGLALGLEAADGRRSTALRSAVPLGPAGALVVTGARWPRELTVAVNRIVPVVRRRWTDEELTRRVIELARRNQALEDFASLVAHELKAPLHAALLEGGATPCVEQALDLVDELLEAARSEAAPGIASTPAEVLADVLRELAPSAAVVAELPAAFPLPPSSLRVVLRNLLANAVAAGAHEISVTVLADDSTLVVDDDGVGLDSAAAYASGSGVGLGLIRRLVARLGGSVELAPRPSGGTRAILAMDGGGR
jgi:signal transduction histidine kinase